LKLERAACQWLYWNVIYKQPRSVQIVVFAESGGERQYLLLRRKADRGGFWLSVTGSLEEGETRAQAAVREVFEETGIRINESQLIDLNVINIFEIAPQWLARYAPGVTTNEEYCFALKVDRGEIRIDATEHEAAVWVNRETAVKMIYWDSNRRAFAAAETIADTQLIHNG
jgi:dATP pyrophosphohydrolase